MGSDVYVRSSGAGLTPCGLLDKTFESNAPVMVPKEKTLLWCEQPRRMGSSNTPSIRFAENLIPDFPTQGPHKLPRRWTYLRAALREGEEIIRVDYLNLCSFYFDVFSARTLIQMRQQAALARTLSNFKRDVRLISETYIQYHTSVTVLLRPRATSFSRSTLRVPGDSASSARGQPGVGLF